MHNVRLFLAFERLVDQTLNMSEFTVLNISNIRISVFLHIGASFYNKIICFLSLSFFAVNNITLWERLMRTLTKICFY